MNSLHPVIRYPLRAIMMMASSMLYGAVVFFAMIAGVFVAAAAIVYSVILGAIFICSLAALTFWLVFHDPNALRAFWMFAVYGSAGCGIVFLIGNVFRAITNALERALKPKDALFFDETPQITLTSTQAPAASPPRGTPWMRNTIT